MNNISKYGDIALKLVESSFVKCIRSVDADIKFDWFDYCLIKGKEANIYSIKKMSGAIGYAALYNFDDMNGNIFLYGKVSEKQYFGDLMKAFLSLLDYAFEQLHVNRVSLIYREDNYFFDDMCRFLHFVKEGIMRNCLQVNSECFNLNYYGILADEYYQYSVSEYRKMFTWDEKYLPNDCVLVNIAEIFNQRTFTNSLDNPNDALLNDSLLEFALNKNINSNNSLEYKAVKFPVNIFDVEAEFDAVACNRQVIDVPSGQYKEVLCVATAQFGYKESKLSLIYSDGEECNLEFTLSDWCERVLRDEHIIHYAYGCRCLGKGANVIKCDAFLYLKRIHIPISKNLVRIELPIDQNILLFALALVK